MAREKKYYSFLFWDYPEIESLARKLSIQDFKRFIASLKTGNPSLFNLILRRFIERGHLTEAFHLYEIEDIEKGLKELHIWDNIPEIRIYAWKHAIEFMKNLKAKHKGEGCRKS
ncbi:MAG: hypothetical protein AB1480_16590 [Nitrospirota bacterium]